MTQEKKCKICGKAFESDKPNAKYCCLSCKEQGRRLRQVEWEKRHPNYRRDYMRKYRNGWSRYKGGKDGEYINLRFAHYAVCDVINSFYGRDIDSTELAIRMGDALDAIERKRL